MLKKYFLYKPLLIAIVTGTVGWLTSCQKSVETFVPDPGQPTGSDTTWVADVSNSMPISMLKESILLQPLTDSLSSNNTDSLVTSSGFKLILPESSLQKLDSTRIDGPVKIDYLALQKKGDLVRMNLPTVIDSAVISAAGTFFISFTKNGSELKLRPFSALRLTMPFQSAPAPNKFFYGEGGAGTIYNWRINADSATNYLQPGNGNYQATVTTLNWILAGYTLPAFGTNVELALPVQYTNANTASYIVLKDYFSVISMSADVAAKKFRCGILPENITATAVVISKQGQDYFAGTQTFTVANGELKIVNVLPVKTTMQALQQLLDGL